MLFILEVMIIIELKINNHFLTVSELIYDDNYYIDENGVQNKK